jgi:hypothetical protein
MRTVMAGYCIIDLIVSLYVLFVAARLPSQRAQWPHSG